MFFIALLLGFFSFIPSAEMPAGMHSAAPASFQSRQQFRVIRTRPFPSISMPSWEGHFSAQKFQSTREDRIALLQVKHNVRKVLNLFPKEQRNVLKNLIIKKEKNPSRGMANSKKIILHTDSISSNDEMVSVLVHEMGHVIDLGGLTSINGGVSNFFSKGKTFFADDPSVDFYNISWRNIDSKKGESVRADFVSGYAMSDPFEDFAESFLFYRLHGEKFRYLSHSSEALQEKYDFFKENVFKETEFQLDKEVTENFIAGKSLVWDATLLEL
jgi:hypothetical protein